MVEERGTWTQRNGRDETEEGPERVITRPSQPPWDYRRWNPKWARRTPVS